MIRADGFRELYSWLEGRDILIVKPIGAIRSSSCGCR
jgi:hypothetical protein